MVATIQRQRPPRAKHRTPGKRRLLRRKTLLAVDTETTGLDIRHGCRPFFLGTVDEHGAAISWEWEVNPKTRAVHVPESDAREIRTYLKGKRLIFHNTGFDVLALSSIGVDVPSLVPWDDIEDTLLGSHVLDSGEEHGLKALALKYLDILDDDESDLRDAVKEARRLGKRESFAIGRVGLSSMLGLTRAPNSGWWVVDMWLPRAIALAKSYPESHKWWGVCSKYGLMDPVRTLGLYFLQTEGLREEGLERLYEVRKRLLPVVHDMQNAGIPLSPVRHGELEDRFDHLEAHHEEETLGAAPVVARSVRIENLNSGPQVRQALYGSRKTPDKHGRLGFGIPVERKTKAGNPSADKDALAAVLLELDPDSQESRFIESLQLWRKCSKMREYLDSYKRYSKVRRVKVTQGGRSRWLKYFLLHSGFNTTGTATTRWSSYWPNAQNISKQEDYNLRYAFGPLPGRNWLSLDYDNIELRIFAYESQDAGIIAEYEAGNSFHTVVCRVLYPQEFRQCEREGVSFKDRYKASYYQWVKNGNFSLIYGASPRKANATYRVSDAYNTIRTKLPTIDAFMASKNDEAKSKGYITTLGGYRLMVPRNKPHVAVNYFVQGSAGWFLTEATIRVHEYLRDHPEHDTRLIMQVHDELDLDTPAPASYELGRKIADLMEQSGTDYGIPCPVDATVVRSNWSKDEALTATAA